MDRHLLWNERDQIAEALPEPRREERSRGPGQGATESPRRAEDEHVLDVECDLVRTDALMVCTSAGRVAGNVAGNVTAGVAALAEALSEVGVTRQQPVQVGDKALHHRCMADLDGDRALRAGRRRAADRLERPEARLDQLGRPFADS